MHTSPKTLVVYNKLNHESLIAAAILKSENPTFETVDIHGLIHEDFESYIWLGIDPDPSVNEIFHRLRDKQNEIIKEDFKETDYAVENRTDVAVRSTIIEKMMLSFDLDDNEVYKKISFHAGHFHDKKTEPEYLLYVYDTIQDAYESLVYGKPFTVESDTPDIKEHMASYKLAVERAKKALQGNYNSATTFHNNVKKNLFHTCIATQDFHLMLRMIKLSHENFINVTQGIHGTILFTNLHNLKVEGYKDAIFTH
jgi:hypothetical protein